MHFHSEQHLDDNVIERAFTLGQIPGTFWAPASASATNPVPLILMGHPGGLARMHPRLAARPAFGRSGIRHRHHRTAGQR